jgi:alpha-glucosidase (family GH31 glycosyl hydrolase)
MPWTYGEKGIELARKFFRLRYSLLPYIYTYCRVAHDQALPIVRPLYLEYPSLDKAYDFPGEYFFGKELLVAPVTDSSGLKEIYLPPGDWYDYFTNEQVKGDQIIRKPYPLDRMPVFARVGSIVPMRSDLAFSDQRPLDTLIVAVYGPDDAKFSLYEDDGISLEYRSSKYAWTPLTFSKRGADQYQLNIGPTKGEFSGQPAQRAYELRFYGLREPKGISVDNKDLKARQPGQEGWWRDRQKSVVFVNLDSRPIGKAITVEIQ